MKRIDRIYIMIAKVKKNIYYDLPEEIILHIWSFDDTYIKLYKNCIYEMQKNIGKNQNMDYIRGEYMLYEMYQKKAFKNQLNLYNNCLTFAQYIFKKQQIYGKNIISRDSLKIHNLNKIERNKKQLKTLT